MAAPISPARSLDARGLRCPLPLVKARNEIELIEVGEILEIVATDPGTDHDFRAWCARKRHQLVSVEQLPGPEFRFLIRRA
ncbi:MAG TPA: sulfurtransferase TusA family protein [Candidatus Solibacter sp.]|jgi:tRNA 2-thiouridine synthesizing protein A|nr:sulfurtransferase TusA family protein [Candidatus Solibacter sp.]